MPSILGEGVQFVNRRVHFWPTIASPIKPAKAEMLIIASIHSMPIPQRKAPECGRLSKNPILSRRYRSEKSETWSDGKR